MLSEGDEDASEVDEAEKVFEAALIAGHQAAEVMQPGEQALDFPAPPVAPQLPSVLVRLPTIGAVGAISSMPSSNGTWSSPSLS